MSKRTQSDCFLRLLYLGLLVFVPAFGNALDWTVTLTPSANLAGPAGSTVEWDYSIQNLNATELLVLNSVNAGSFQHGNPLSIFDFPIVAPLTTLTGPLYQLTFDQNAPTGAVDSGTFDFTADFFVVDQTGSVVSITAAPDKSVPYSATVATTVATPEPRSAVLLITALSLAIFRIRKCLRTPGGSGR
jgi:hypothetical protein